jgi:hypothetical protein
VEVLTNAIRQEKGGRALSLFKESKLTKCLENLAAMQRLLEPASKTLSEFQSL